MADAPATPPRSSFARYWGAAAVSSFGTAVTAVAMPVLVVQVLEATPLQIGIVNAAQFVPYAVLGLFAGVYVDRWRRKPILVWAGIGRALALGSIVALWLADALQIWILVVALLLFGAFSVMGFAATQSLLPHLVPRHRLVVANARLDQTDAAAQTLGPTLGGGLVGLLGAPLTIMVDAVSYLVDAALIAGIRVEEERTNRPRRLWGEVGEGLRWTYRHRTLGPLAMSTHVWFLGNSAALTVLSILALRTLEFSPFAYGLLFAVLGLTSLIGATAAPRVGDAIGAGRAIILARSTYPLVWILVAAAPSTGFPDVLIFVALGVQGLAAGVENANEMGYWQATTPDGLLGRTNAVRRSANRTLAAVGALLAGLLVGLVGAGPVLLGVVALLVTAAAVVWLSPLRYANR